MLEICRTYYAVESGAAAMCAGGKSVSAVRTNNFHKRGPHNKSAGTCKNCTRQHPPGRDNCPAKDARCNACGKTGHWKPKCRSTKGNDSKPQQDHRGKRGKKPKRADVVDVDDDSTLVPTHEFGIGAVDLDQLPIDDMNRAGSSEAYTQVQIPSSIPPANRATIRVKVDTGAGGNVLPLRIFKAIHPKCIDRKGRPTGLTPTSTKLTAYNGTDIPCYGALKGPAEWQPGNKRQAKRRIQTCWY